MTDTSTAAIEALVERLDKSACHSLLAFDIASTLQALLKRAEAAEADRDRMAAALQRVAEIQEHMGCPTGRCDCFMCQLSRISRAALRPAGEARSLLTAGREALRGQQ